MFCSEYCVFPRHYTHTTLYIHVTTLDKTESHNRERKRASGAARMRAVSNCSSYDGVCVSGWLAIWLAVWLRGVPQQANSLLLLSAAVLDRGRQPSGIVRGSMWAGSRVVHPSCS
jgi:hypothetical protein